MAEISVELRLVLDALKKDIAEAAKAMKAGLSVNIGQTATGTERAAKAMDDLGKKTRATTEELRKQKQVAMDAWRASLPAPRVMGSGFDKPPAANYSGYGPTMNPIQGPMGPGGGLATPPGLRAPGYNGPRPPVLVPPKLPTGGGAGGFLLAAAASALGNIVANLFSQVVAAVKRLAISLVHAFTESFDNARRNYAKALTSGVGIGYSTHRAQLASVIGVSDQEVMHFGAAVEYLNSRLAFSGGIIAATTQNLTATSWSFKVLGENVKAMFATIGDLAAPALRNLADAISGIVTVVTMAMNNPQFKLLSKLAELQTGGMARLLTGGSNPSAPSPVASANRMAGSAWERMGLVLGTMGGGNYQKQTADNTRKIVGLLEKISGISSMRGGYGGAPHALVTNGI